LYQKRTIQCALFLIEKQSEIAAILAQKAQKHMHIYHDYNPTVLFEILSSLDANKLSRFLIGLLRKVSTHRL
jgi:hypothetical protein